jgi:hypothetical protein
MSSHPVKSSAPLGIKLLSALVIIDGAGLLWNGITLLIGGNLPVATMAIGLATLQILVAAGLWMLEPYAWGAAMFVLGFVFTLEVATGYLPGAALTAVVGLYLFSKRDLFET